MIKKKTFKQEKDKCKMFGNGGGGEIDIRM